LNEGVSKGIFILDIEVELAWGIIDKKLNKKELTRTFEKVRIYLDDILRLLDKYNIVVTWSFLGHAILDRCERKKGMPHPEMPRPSYKWMRGDWYKHDPCKNFTEEPAFYGKDITDRIVNHTLNADVPHDFSVHSFSHQLFGDRGCSRKLADAEVKRSVQLMAENYSLKPTVFIFPRESLGHFDVLKKNGIIAFRGVIPRTITYLEPVEGFWNFIRKYSSLAAYWMSFYLNISPPVTWPKKEHGLVNIPASLCYNKKPFIPLKLVVLKAKKGIDRAIKERKIFYVATHLRNFGEVSNTKAFLEGFETILKYAHSQRRKDKLEIATVARIAELFSSNKRRYLKVN